MAQEGRYPRRDFTLRRDGRYTSQLESQMEEANDMLQRAMRASDPSTTSALMDQVLPSLERKVVLANKEPDVRLVVAEDLEDDADLDVGTTHSSGDPRVMRFLASSSGSSAAGKQIASSASSAGGQLGQSGRRGGRVVLYAHSETMAKISEELSLVIRRFQEDLVNDTVSRGLGASDRPEDDELRRRSLALTGDGADGREEEDEEEDDEEKEFKARCVEVRVQEGSKEHTDHALRKLWPFVAIRTRHVQDALHILYNPEERIGGLDPQDPAGEADAFIGTFHFLVKYGVRHVEVLKRIRECLAERPSIACLLLARAYGFCDKRPEEHLFDLEKFLFSELSHYRDEELRKFRYYNILEKETQLKIADMRIRSLEHLFKDPGIFWKPHFRNQNEKRIMPPSYPKVGSRDGRAPSYPTRGSRNG